MPESMDKGLLAQQSVRALRIRRALLALGDQLAMQPVDVGLDDLLF